MKKTKPNKKEIKGVLELVINRFRKVNTIADKYKILTLPAPFCLSPLNNWTKMEIHFRTLNLRYHEQTTQKMERI
jgi:hypothetical protein